MTVSTHSLNLRQAEVQAILHGATQLRRPLADQEALTAAHVTHWHTLPHVSQVFMADSYEGNDLLSVTSPFGVAGDWVWVRETWAKYAGWLLFKADAAEQTKETELLRRAGRHWESPMHMHQADSRLRLRIVSVTIQPIQAVTAAQAAACLGQPTLEHRGLCFELSEQPLYFTDCPACQMRSHFLHGWWVSQERKLRQRQWLADPWCWCVDFERIQV